MAGSYNQLFEDERIRVHEIIDYKSGYGIVLGGQSKRLQKCFQTYVKRKRSYIINYVATQIKTVKVSVLVLHNNIVFWSNNLPCHLPLTTICTDKTEVTSRESKELVIVVYFSSYFSFQKNPKSAAEDSSTNLFNPKSDIFVISITVCMSLLVVAIIAGFFLQFYFKRRFRSKVQDSTESELAVLPRISLMFSSRFLTTVVVSIF